MTNKITGKTVNVTYEKYKLVTDNPVKNNANLQIQDDATKAAVAILGQRVGDGTEESVYTTAGSNTTGRADTNVYVFDNEDDWLAYEEVRR